MKKIAQTIVNLLFHRFVHKLVIGITCAFLVTIIPLGFLLVHRMENHLLQEITNSLSTSAGLIRHQIPPRWLEKPVDEGAWEKIRQYGRLCECRVTLIRADGLVVADSEIPPVNIHSVENHGTRSEVLSALEGEVGRSTRTSQTIAQKLLYVSIPYYVQNRISGVVRLAISLEEMNRKVHVARNMVVNIGLVSLLLGVLVAVWLARSLGRPVRSIAEVADQIAHGNYQARARIDTRDETGQLAASINRLAERIKLNMDELGKEKSHLSSILARMVEGVVAVDNEGKITTVNPALCHLFEIDPDQSLGKPLLEVLRHHQISRIINTVLESNQPVSEEVHTFSPEENIFEALALPLVREGRAQGALLVLHEITRLRKLEKIRREFVANVSHELRTPLAAIKGFTETLLSGALKEPQNAREFLNTIDRQADRMNKLVEDLLDLSAIESGKRVPLLEPLNLEELAVEVAETLKPSFQKHKIKFSIDSFPNVKVIADKMQLRQVLTNLLDNAAKFNREGGAVRMWADVNENLLKVHVEDTGIGIPNQDLGRIYERFYRVDKARSRDLGGTGLGLSIVKHIVESHGGKVGVDSVMNEGSHFWFMLPLNLPAA